MAAIPKATQKALSRKSKYCTFTGNQGWYTAKCIESSLEDNASSEGQHIRCTFKIITGSHIGERIVKIFNIRNASASAERAALAQLKSFVVCSSGGKDCVISDTDELIGLVCRIFINEREDADFRFEVTDFCMCDYTPEDDDEDEDDEDEVKQPSFKENKAWADKYMPEIMHKLLNRFDGVRLSTKTEDMCEATDLVVYYVCDEGLCECPVTVRTLSSRLLERYGPCFALRDEPDANGRTELDKLEDWEEGYILSSFASKDSTKLDAFYTFAWHDIQAYADMADCTIREIGEPYIGASGERYLLFRIKDKPIFRDSLIFWKNKAGYEVGIE